MSPHSKLCQLSRGLSARIHVTKRCAHTHGRNLRHTKYRLRQSKMIGQRKSGRNAKFKLPQMLNSLSLSLPICLSTCTICMYMCIYLSISLYIYFPLYIRHFTCSLFSVFVGVFFCKAEEPGPITDHWCSA